MIGAEWGYQHRWRGRSVKPADDDAQDYLLKRFDTVRRIRERWIDLEKGVRKYLSTVPESKLREPLTYAGSLTVRTNARYNC
jgi:hypothetical protein